MKLKRMWIACAESKGDAFTANRAAMREYLLEHAYDFIELQEAAIALANHWTMGNSQRIIDALAKLEE